MKVALVHDYLTQRGGAERVFELICKRFPEADIYTSLYDAKNTIDLGEREVHTTYLQKWPGSIKFFRLMAPFYYNCFQSLNLLEYDLIISSTSAFAKALRKRPDAKHICFCHNITRFLWDTKVYLQEYRSFQAFYPLIEKLFQPMRSQDIIYAQYPDLYIANSSTVAKRIEKIYKKEAKVINYPVDESRFKFSDQKEEYYLVAARLISYKRIDIIIEAFNWLGLPLLIIGDGPEKLNLESRALSNIQFLGHVTDTERSHLLSKAKFVIVAALEDYGLVPIEANLSGTPVISYGAGGVLDTQIPGKTGLFFQRKSPEAIQEAVYKANKVLWDYHEIRKHALNNFTEEVFFKKVEGTIQEFNKSRQVSLAYV